MTPLYERNGTAAPPALSVLELLARALLDGTSIRMTIELGFARPEPGPSAARAKEGEGGGEEGALTECEADIIRLLVELGERLTGDRIKSEFARRQLLHGESTVDKALARLVHVKNRLTNRRDSYGKGYGLADWPLRRRGLPNLDDVEVPSP